jgi:hypothetical protein
LIITVQRYDAKYPAPDIVEPLLTDIQAAIARGRKELDGGEPLQVVRLTCLYSPVVPGDLVEIQDTYQGGYYRGKVTSVEHSASENSLKTNLELVRI